MRPFQVLLIGVFLALGVGGILVFSFYKGVGQGVNPYGTSVVIWGTVDKSHFFAALDALKQKDENFKVVSYVEKDERTFQQELINALSEQRGPDIVLISADMLVQNRKRIAPISYAQVPARTFKETYIDGAEIFMMSEGLYALPLAVDPVVMYWNRDIFATKGFAGPPKTWEALAGMVPRIAEKTFTSEVTRAAVAFGEYVNVRNAKDTLITLLMQAGSNLVVDRGTQISVELNQKVAQGIPPAQAVLDFYTLFSNPSKEVYTWNRALPQDRDEFLAGDLALYFGRASEVRSLQNGNPNLNFDVAEIPQNDGAPTKKGYGRFYGLALMKSSSNPVGAQSVLLQLSAQDQSNAYASYFDLGPVYRASHNTPPSDPFLAIVYRAALVARGWLDPDPVQSDAVLRSIVDDVTSGRQPVTGAINDAQQRLQQLIQ